MIRYETPEWGPSGIFPTAADAIDEIKRLNSALRMIANTANLNLKPETKIDRMNTIARAAIKGEK